MFEITSNTKCEPVKLVCKFLKCHNLESPEKRSSIEELSRSSYPVIISLGRFSSLLIDGGIGWHDSLGKGVPKSVRQEKAGCEQANQGPLVSLCSRLQMWPAA